MNFKTTLKGLTPPLFWRALRGLYHFLQRGLFRLSLALGKGSNEKQDFCYTTDYVSVYTPQWREHLEVFQGRPQVKMLEIGSFEGRSSVWFLQHILTHPSAQLTCIDSFARAGGEMRFDHNIRVSGEERKVQKLKGPSEEVLCALEDSEFDIIYIDGCHQALNVLMDCTWCWLHLKPGGVLILDDYLWELGKPKWDRPQWAIDLFLESKPQGLQILHRDYQMILKKDFLASDLVSTAASGT